MPSQTEIQEDITARIIEGLKSGTVPWRKPWRDDPNCGAPANVISRRHYRGINPILLDLTAMSRGFNSRWWGTYLQWSSLGAKVRKRPDDVKPGRWGTTVVFYKQIAKKTTDENGDAKSETFPLMRSFTVFNLDQVEGEAVEHLRASNESSSPAIPDCSEAERVIAATGADIRFGGNRAVYARPVGTWPNHHDGDFITVPPRNQFKSVHDLYSTLMHECIHWSEVRLGWAGSYAMGELIAELGSSFACASVNIPSSDDLSNHTAYLASWLEHLENDRKFIFKAAAQASKATEFILSFSKVTEEVPELEEVGH
jgi:antirestriction protein ArdC